MSIKGSLCEVVKKPAIQRSHLQFILVELVLEQFPAEYQNSSVKMSKYNPSGKGTCEGSFHHHSHYR